jgi:hypothetical protein
VRDLAVLDQGVNAGARENKDIGRLAGLDSLDQLRGKAIGDCELVPARFLELWRQLLQNALEGDGAASSAGGTVRPSALAVLRLTISSNLVGCITGRSAGFAPLRIRPV